MNRAVEDPAVKVRPLKRILITTLITLCGVCVAAQQKPFTVSVDVDIVLMNVRVTDRNGQAVAGLNKANFELYEDRKLQDISFFSGEDSPATIGLIVDASNSMGPKWNSVRDAVAAFAHASNPQDEMLMVQFNEHLFWPLKPKEFTNDPADLMTAMDRLSPGGTTALYDAIAAALDHSKRGRFERKIFVVIGDGEDNSSEQSLEDLLTDLQRANVAVYCLGIYDPDASDKNPKVLRQLSTVTGGEAFFPKNRQQVQEALQTIATRIRNQYTLGFYPSTSPDGSFHRLSVRIHPSERGVSIHTRPGYFARRK